MDNRTGFRRRGPAYLADQARLALGVPAEPRSLADVPLPLVHTALGAAVCALAVLLRPEEIGAEPGLIAGAALSGLTGAALLAYDRLVYARDQRPGVEGVALPVAAVLAFVTVLAGSSPSSVQAVAGAVAALVVGGVPQLAARRALGAEGWLVRLLRDIAGILVLAPVLLAGASTALASGWRTALVGMVAALGCFDGLRTERLSRGRAVPAAMVVGALTALAAALVGPAGTNPGVRGAVLLVLWYGLRGMAGASALPARRWATLLEYGAFVVLAAAALRWVALNG